MIWGIWTLQAILPKCLLLPIILRISYELYMKRNNRRLTKLVTPFPKKENKNLFLFHFKESGVFPLALTRRASISFRFARGSRATGLHILPTCVEDFEASFWTEKRGLDRERKERKGQGGWWGKHSSHTRGSVYVPLPLPNSSTSADNTILLSAPGTRPDAAGVACIRHKTSGRERHVTPAPSGCHALCVCLRWLARFYFGCAARCDAPRD